MTTPVPGPPPLPDRVPLTRWMIRGGDGVLANPMEAASIAAALHDLAHDMEADAALREDLAFRLRALGVPVPEIASLAHVSQPTVYRWLKAREERR